MTVAQEKLEKALEYLATSAKEWAEAKGQAEWLDEQRRIVRSEAFRQAKAGGAGVGEAEAISYGDPRYGETVGLLRDAITKEALLRAYREAAAVTIEVWRSENAARRAANV